MKTRKVSFAQSASKSGSSNRGATCDAMMGSASRDETAEFGVLLLSLQERIQQRLASDLHDSTCQHLIAVSLNIMRMRRAMNDLGSVERICDDIDASIEQALREIRAFTYLLHPQNLLADGLKTTVEQFVDGFSARTSLKASVNIAPEADRLSYEAQRSVLRVIQEALTNVFRHAKATQVKIAMYYMSTLGRRRHVYASPGVSGAGGTQARSRRRRPRFRQGRVWRPSGLPPAPSAPSSHG